MIPTGPYNTDIAGISKTENTLTSLAESFSLDSYIRILDFSKPVDPSKNSIDIRTDNITIAIRLPDDIPRLENAILLISDGVMHMLPGDQALEQFIADEAGNIRNYSHMDLVNRVWDFNLEAQQWSVHDSGIETPLSGTAVAFDVEKQVGWYYGGYDSFDRYSPRMKIDRMGPDLENLSRERDIENLFRPGSQDLYRLDRGKGTPIKVNTNSSIVESITGGELIYIGGAGEAGVLVLMGGFLNTEAFPEVVSILNQIQISELCQ